MLPSYVQKFVDTHIMSQIQRFSSRFTDKHKTHYHIAMLFQGHKNVAVGQNRAQARGRGRKKSNTIHAEADVIRSIGNYQKLKGSKLFVIRIAPSGIAYSAPCIACQCLLNKCMKEYGMLGYGHS